MGYIYVITNQINQKQYVGQTSFSIEERFKQHIKDSSKYLNRPLYKAFNKYGIENFSIAKIEECPDEALFEREKYWIKELNTYHFGYNATLGGEGTTLYNHNQILERLKENTFLSDLIQEFGCDPKIIRAIAKENNIYLENKARVTSRQAVKCFDKKTNEFIKEFSSMTEAAQWLIKNGYSTMDIKNYKDIRGKISQAARHLRKTAYGFIWEFQ